MSDKTSYWTAVKMGRDRWGLLFLAPWPKEFMVVARGRRSLERKVQRMHDHAARISGEPRTLVCLGVVE